MPLIPASIWKIITAAAALKILGPDFRFQTNFYQNHTGDLYIQGRGDPFLVSEEIAVIYQQLKTRDTMPIQRIILDNTAFELTTSQPAGSGRSLNPYDAQNSALAVNFNTIHIIKNTSGTISSAEEQTPTLPIMREAGATLKPGKHRIPLNQEPTQALLYVTQLFQALGPGTTANGQGLIIRQVPPELEPLYSHSSTKKLTTLIAELMLYSNNYIANQLFLTIGAVVSGYPATWEKGQLALQAFLADDLHLNPEEFRVMEGSGLSRQNMITPRAMIVVLDYFQDYADLLPNHQGHRVKSGTLRGVYSYAGYFVKLKKLEPFVIMLNQPRNTRDRIFKLLKN